MKVIAKQGAVILRAILPVLCLFYTGILSAQFAGGDGSADNPFQVATPVHLAMLNLYLGQEHTFKYFVLTSDIDLNVVPYNVDQGWQPIGVSEVQSFRGNLDGNGHKISNLFINRTGPQGSVNIGLFGFLYNAQISNIKLEDVSVRGRTNVGGLVGRSERSAVDGCSSSGSVRGLANLVGGLIGLNSRSTITRSYSTADVQGVDQTGGLTGQSFANAFISECFSTGTVSGRFSVGGLVGENYTGNICNSYSHSRTEGNRNVGGLAGRSVNRSFVTNCYSTGYVIGSFTTGGLLGASDENETVNSYWNMQTSGQNFSAAGTGRSTFNMISPYSQTTYEEWDFREVWVEDRLHLINNGYPFLHSYSSYISPHPTNAINPNPAHNLTNVGVVVDSLRWMFISDPSYPDPVGFKVFLNTTGQFIPQDAYFWVGYVPGQYDYAGSLEHHLPLHYETEYFWKVVPTTNNPFGYRGDAQNSPVWSFRTQANNPHPHPANVLSPPDGAEYVSVGLTALRWEYIPMPGHALPRGFKIYLDETGEFGEDASDTWEGYRITQRIYETSLLFDLQPATTYYWKVIPTTAVSVRNDAPDCPVWVFSTDELSSLQQPETGLITILNNNYPNPFNPQTTISYTLATPASVNLAVYNIHGQIVRTLQNRSTPAGNHQIIWNGDDDTGKLQPSGVYYVKLLTPDYQSVIRIVLLK